MDENPRLRIRLAVQSEHRLLREVLAAYFMGHTDFELVGCTSGMNCLDTLCELRRPDAALIELCSVRSLPINELSILHERNPWTQLVVWHSELDPDELQAAAALGICALVPDSRGLPALIRMLGRGRPRVNGEGPGRPGLTDRELGILQLMGVGFTSPAIAEILQISPYTVENHKRHIYAKLNVGHQSEAVSRATCLGLLDARAGVPSSVALTGREQEILDSIAIGHTIRQTANTLGIAEKTVENLQAGLFRKLGTHNRSETVARAHYLGLVDATFT